ncbi:hypothetical protein N8I74_15330 [Chitiniphilus purpureus]|uniref:Uncharacterized protein n=1 Tax=Chitiniphilus purpureus TaxID=2981137 RepID=A0ABY6DNI5_9NEIS|nr:hypothetical protein [Chitiniphilus sp. CD1]UXY14676.1 hypothetical protein N8I74_15330 [Chitiniphilus sp. CD1]
MTDPTLFAADGTALLPNQPFQAVYYHYGMLLGVDDFNTDQAYHRGKARLHAAWLHGWGTVWGLKVTLDAVSGELRVAPGLALDGVGRELPLEVLQCLKLGQWYAAHADEVTLKQDDAPGDLLVFDAHVVIRHRACLARPVPALVDTCAGGGSETAYSRVIETTQLLLKPGRAPQPPQRNHLVRVLLGLAEPRADGEGNPLPDDADAVAARAALPGQGLLQRLAALRRFAILDALAQPVGGDSDEIESQLFAADAPLEIPLAEVLDLTLQPDGDDYRVTAGEVDNLIRPVLLPTQTLQDALAPQPAAAQSGPRLRSDAVSLAGKVLTLPFDKPVLASTLNAAAVSAGILDPGSGWQSAVVADCRPGAAPGTVEVELTDDPAGRHLRVVLPGTGATPILGDDHLPLFGDTGAFPVSIAEAQQGRDAVWTH